MYNSDENDDIEIIDVTDEYYKDVINKCSPYSGFAEIYQTIILNHSIYNDDIINKNNNESISEMTIQDLIRYVKKGSTYLKDILPILKQDYHNNTYHLDINFNDYFNLDIEYVNNNVHFRYILKPNNKTGNLEYQLINIKYFNKYLIFKKLIKNFVPSYINNETSINFIQNLLHMNKSSIEEILKTNKYTILKQIKLNFYCSRDNYIVRSEIICGI